MSKSNVKKLLSEMPKEDIIKVVMGLYDAKKEAKEYLDYYLDPRENEMLEKYRLVIKEEFYPAKETAESQTRFSVCRKAISDFEKLKPSPENIAELMVSLVEYAALFSSECGDLWEQYYDSVVNNYRRAMKYIQKHGLMSMYQSRLRKCLLLSEGIGWGFEEMMYDVYEEYCGSLS